MQTHTARRRGFTLIELLMVIGIIAVLASLIIGSFWYLVVHAKVLKTKYRMQDVMNRLLDIRFENRATADIIQEKMMGERVRFVPVRQDLETLIDKWGVDIEALDAYYAGSEAIEDTHLTKLPPRVWSKHDPFLGTSNAKGGGDSWSDYIPTWVVTAWNNRLYSPLHLDNKLDSVLCKMVFRNYNDNDEPFYTNNDMHYYSQGGTKSAEGGKVRTWGSLGWSTTNTGWFGFSATTHHPYPNAILRTKLNSVLVVKHTQFYGEECSNVEKNYFTPVFSSLDLWYHPDGLLGGALYRHGWEFWHLSNQDFLNEMEVRIGEPTDPQWVDLLTPAPAAWLTAHGLDGGTTGDAMLAGPWKYYEKWPLYLELKDYDSSVPTDLGNIEDPDPVLYSYAWPHTDWDQRDPGTVPPIWEMPFGQYIITRKGDQPQQYQQRPYHDYTDGGKLKIGQRNLAQFSPLYTLTMLQLAEVVLAGSEGATEYRSKRHPDLNFNDAWGNPLTVAVAGFLVPRYDIYFLDRNGNKDECVNISAEDGVTVKPRAEFHEMLRGGRDWLLRRCNEVYGRHRAVYISLCAMGPVRGVFGLDNPIVEKLPDWEAAVPLQWQAADDPYVFRAAWKMACELNHAEDFTDAYMADNEWGTLATGKSGDIRTIILPPGEVQ